MKEQTLDALTSDVKARTGFFEFVKQNKQNIFGILIFSQEFYSGEICERPKT
jgi:hypothetical protein